MYTDYRISQTIADAHRAELRQHAEHRRTVRLAKGRTARRATRAL